MKNENVPFDRRPSDENALSDVQTPIDESPQLAKEQGARPRIGTVVKVKHPRINRHLTNQTDDEQKNQNVIVQRPCEQSTAENVVEDQQGADRRRNDENQIDAEFHRWRNEIGNSVLKPIGQNRRNGAVALVHRVDRKMNGFSSLARGY